MIQIPALMGNPLVENRLPELPGENDLWPTDHWYDHVLDWIGDTFLLLHF